MKGRKEPAGYQEWGSRLKQGQEAGAASKSTDGGGNTAVGSQTGKKKKKKIEAADLSTEKRISVRWENIQKLQKILDGKEGSVRETYKSQTEANGKAWSLNLQSDSGST